MKSLPFFVEGHPPFLGKPMIKCNKNTDHLGVSDTQIWDDH